MISSNFSLVFRISVRHIESAILNLKNLMADLDSATLKTYLRTISSSYEHFSKFWPPYWIRHFEFWKFDGRFGFSDLKNLCTENFIEFWSFFKILAAILDPPIWISKIWQQIRIQRSQKHNNVRFHLTFLLFFESWSAILDLLFWI